MAQLRGEVVQPRRLAEHIDNLSQEAAAHRRKRAMTDTTITDTKGSQRPQRSKDGRPVSGKSSRNFNPMHPSMELPPEQLIRLLGVESKKTRKYQKSRRAPEKVKSQPAPEDAKPQRAPQDVQSQPASVQTKSEITTGNKQKSSKQKAQRQPNREIQYERTTAPVFNEKRTGLLVPSLVVGVLAGVMVSAYLFWAQPSPASKQKTAAPVTSDKPGPQVSGQLVKRKPAAPATSKGKAPAKVIGAGLPAQAPAQAKTARAGTDRDWQAGVQAEQNRLRQAAEQRHAKHVMRIEVEREAAQLLSPQASDIDPATAPPEQVESAPTPVPVTEPAAAAFGLPPVEQAQPEPPHADQALAMPPGDDLSTSEAGTAADASGGDTDEPFIDPAISHEGAVGADETAGLAPPPEVVAPVSSQTDFDAANDPSDGSEPDDAPSIGHEAAPAANSSTP